MNAIFKRVSVRSYLEQPIESEKIEMLLRAGMQAPSAHNQQPWEFYVVTARKKLLELSEATPYSICVAKAPLAIVPCYRKELQVADYAAIDMSACCENILLEAVNQSLGGVWIGIAPVAENITKVTRMLSLPDHLTPFAILSIGYPKREKEIQSRFDTRRIHTVE